MAEWYDPSQEAQVRAQEHTRALLFLLRFFLLFALAAVFWVTGWSRELELGLRQRLSFPYSWPCVCAVFTALAVFGYEAILFPLSVLADYTLVPEAPPPDLRFGSWLKGYLRTLAIEVALMSAAFTALYTLMRLFPSGWWLAATAAYGVLISGLGEGGAAWLLPRLRPSRPGQDPELDAELSRLGQLVGLEVEGAGYWSAADGPELEEARMVRVGCKRRIIFSPAAWQNHGRAERIFLAAREIARERHHWGVAEQVIQGGLAAAVFWGSARLTDWLARRQGMPGAAALGAFPFLVVSLFALAAVAGMIAHAIHRRVDLHVDRFAVLEAGGASVLRSYLAQAFAQKPFPVTASAWQILLLRRQPTPAQRLAWAEKWKRHPEESRSAEGNRPTR